MNTYNTIVHVKRENDQRNGIFLKKDFLGKLLNETGNSGVLQR